MNLHKNPISKLHCSHRNTSSSSSEQARKFISLRNFPENLLQFATKRATVFFARKYDFRFLIVGKLQNYKIIRKKSFQTWQEVSSREIFNQQIFTPFPPSSPRFPSAGAPIPSLNPLIKIINSTFNLCGVAILILQFISCVILKLCTIVHFFS
jgi:hypothetical protein